MDNNFRFENSQIMLGDCIEKMQEISDKNIDINDIL